MATTTMTQSAAMRRALTLARGTYQRDILLGRARVSGADLQGKAARWGARYYESRWTVLGRVWDAGLPMVIARWPRAHGLLTVEWGTSARKRVQRQGGEIYAP